MLAGKWYKFRLFMGENRDEFIALGCGEGKDGCGSVWEVKGGGKVVGNSLEMVWENVEVG
jgi:hypothetical protein